jgi:hypothetical protein
LERQPCKFLMSASKLPATSGWPAWAMAVLHVQ